MSESPLTRFLEALNSDDSLRERVVQAEQAAATNIERGAEAITSVAAEAGFDLRDWKIRPDDATPLLANQEFLGNACCFVVTSTV
jgi:hypothetical protein